MTTTRSSPGTEHMKIWFDTEFIEDGNTIDLISIGLIREDGATYYAETDQWIPGKASQWVKDNVIVHLKGGDAIKPRDMIAREIVELAGWKPEFWAYYADYDWVALCQLFGTMMHLPEGWPMYCRDVKQLCDFLGGPKLPHQSGIEHHALADAVWAKEAWDFLKAPDVAQQPTWRPIETAPKDGSICDLLLVGGGRVTDQWWDNDSKSWCGLGNDMFSHWMAAPYPIYTASSTTRGHQLAEDCICTPDERASCPACIQPSTQQREGE